MSRETDYNDWDKIVKECEKQFDLMTNTRIGMAIAEQCQQLTYKLALKERAKFPEPEPEPKEEKEMPGVD